MTWSETWSDILNGGHPRWKIDDETVKAKALAHIAEHLDDKNTSVEILCPLAGDDGFVFHAWKQGHSVTTIELVPAAVAAMRQQFGPDDSWTKQENDNHVVWMHNSGRATLYQCNVLKELPELKGKFDAVYDKDAFGALDMDMRSPYCKRLADYTKENGVLYTEVKLKEKDHPQREAGPPYSVDKEILVEISNFGEWFDVVKSLGEVYPLPMPKVSQTGHVLKRNDKKV